VAIKELLLSICGIDRKICKSDAAQELRKCLSTAPELVCQHTDKSHAKVLKSKRRPMAAATGAPLPSSGRDWVRQAAVLCAQSRAED
jgi:hypothetical protein